VRILNVNASLDPLDGGLSERTFQMSRWLAASGEAVDVLVLEKGLTADRLEAIRPASVIPLHMLVRRYYVPRESKPIREVVERADVIHLMGYWSVLNALVVKEALRAGKPYVLCPAGSWRLRGRSMALKIGFDRFIGRRMVEKSARLIAITEQERDLFESYGVPRSKIVLMPNAVDPDAFRAEDDQAFRREFALGARPFILFLGRLDPVKGPDLLLEAYARSATATTHDLVYAGPDGGMLLTLQTRCRELGLGDRVRFLESIYGQEKSMALHAASFLAIPSRHEAMSIVVLEAGVSGTPVLLTDQCGLDEVEKFGGGIVVKTDVQSIANGLDRMRAADLERMSRAIRELILDRYTWESLVPRYKRLYGEILELNAAAVLRRGQSREATC
jgi:glycosyltransferase involved in cell wall biosynthesis